MNSLQKLLNRVSDEAIEKSRLVVKKLEEHDYHSAHEAGIEAYAYQRVMSMINEEINEEYGVTKKAKTATVFGFGTENPKDVKFEVDNDFFNDISEVTIDGNVFIKIPTRWRKINSVNDGQITSFTISTEQIDKSYEPYSVFVDEGGKIMPYVLIGKYRSSASKGMLNSVGGFIEFQTISEARNGARAVGNGYQQWDWQFQKLWQDLIICAMNTVDINDGIGIDTDKLGIVWKYGGNWVDGVAASETEWFFSYNPSAYVDFPTAELGYKIASFTPPQKYGEISKLGYDSSHPFFNQPTATVSNSLCNAYYCDGYWCASGSARPLSSNVGDANACFGAFDSNVSSSWSSAYGARLCYRPLTA